MWASAEMERERMRCYVLGFEDIDQAAVAVVGGKGANLGELSRLARRSLSDGGIDGLRVPAGFCVTTAAFHRMMADAPSMEDRLDRLSRLRPDEREAIRALSAEIRATLEAIAIPDDVAAAIATSLARLGEHRAYAVRSSATSEDLPTASFAGQQDTYLNVVGAAAILQQVSRCSCRSSWATSGTCSQAPPRGASSRGSRRPGRRSRNCCSACGLCLTASRRPKRPNG
jgi:pyruvate,water dikinase